MIVPRLLNLLMIFQSEIAETMDWLITYLLGSAASRRNTANARDYLHFKPSHTMAFKSFI